MIYIILVFILSSGASANGSDDHPCAVITNSLDLSLSVRQEGACTIAGCGGVSNAGKKIITERCLQALNSGVFCYWQPSIPYNIYYSVKDSSDNYHSITVKQCPDNIDE